MIEIEGRVLAGLDEFMLRTGHLAVLCRIASEIGGSWPRIQREAVLRLSAPCKIESERNAEVAEYLAAKKLCRVDGPSRADDGSANYTYPELEVWTDSSGHKSVRSTEKNGDISISWQDSCFADYRARSRVGAISGIAKFGSKTGLSHVCDWAQFLEFMNSAGQLSPVGRLLVGITAADTTPFEDWNPYILGPERIIVAYQYLRNDIDLFARFAPRILGAGHPLTKSASRELFVDSLLQCEHDAEKTRSMRPRLRYELSQQVRDLERAARKVRTDIRETSTAWHRTASRMETMTDLGLLEKDRRHKSDTYRYIYYPTERLRLAAQLLHNPSTSDDWIDENVVDIVLGPVTEQASDIRAPAEIAISDIHTIVKTLKLPTTQIPINCLILGIAYLDANRNQRRSLHDLRVAVEDLPAQFPQLARLARGREGIHAEYISISAPART